MNEQVGFPRQEFYAKSAPRATYRNWGFFSYRMKILEVFLQSKVCGCSLVFLYCFVTDTWHPDHLERVLLWSKRLYKLPITMIYQHHPHHHHHHNDDGHWQVVAGFYLVIIALLVCTKFIIKIMTINTSISIIYTSRNTSKICPIFWMNLAAKNFIWFLAQTSLTFLKHTPNLINSLWRSKRHLSLILKWCSKIVIQCHFVSEIS